MSCACKASTHIDRIVDNYGDGPVKSGASLSLYIKKIFLYILIVPVVPVFVGINIIKGFTGGKIRIDKHNLGWTKESSRIG